MSKMHISTTKLAEICGVSQGTVDRALNNRTGISEKTRRLIVETAKQYGYRQKSTDCKMIGIVVFDLYNEYFSKMIMSLEKACRKRGYFITVMFSGKSFSKELECIESLYCAGVDGIILCPVGSDDKYSKYLNFSKLPIVTFGNRITGHPFSGIDDTAAMYDAAVHLIKRGFTNIVYYTTPAAGDRFDNAQKKRFEGFISAASEYDITYKIVYTVEDAANELKLTENSAAICTSGVFALRLCRLVKKHAIMGFDDISAVGVRGISIDTVTYSYDEIAENAVSALLGKASDCPLAEHTIKECEL